MTRRAARQARRALPLLAACLAAAGCRTTYHVVKGTTKLAVGTVELAGYAAYKTTATAVHIVKDFGYYAAKAATLRGFHDSRPLDGRQVARALRGGPRYHKLPPYRGGYGWPLHAGIVSSEFGSRWGRHHDGIDVAADMGEPVLAAAPGRVIYAGHGLRGYGNVVILRHDAKTTTLYAHNSKLEVKVGQRVKGGQEIAKLGSTGHSTGPHVHFEIRLANVPVDPRSKLPESGFKRYGGAEVAKRR